MSYCRRDGKDQIIFATEEDLKEADVQSTEADSPLEESDDLPQGAILPNGEINWDCPCFGGMPDGPCGDEFKAAFSCFVNSKEEPKGSDCMEQFVTMSSCTRRFPELFPEETEEERGEAQTTVEAQATVEVQETVEVQKTVEAQATVDAQAAVEAQAPAAKKE